MAEVQDIPVSVTYTGKTMQRHEVVAYLKELCFYKVAQDELKEAVNGMSSRIQELETKYNKRPMPPPSEKPPERNWVGLVFWLVILAAAGIWMMTHWHNRIIKMIGIGAMALFYLCCIIGEKDSYKKSCEDWEASKETYAKEQVWRKEVEANQVDGKPKEIAEAMRERQGYQEALGRIGTRCQELEAENVLPSGLLAWPIPAKLKSYFDEGRVNTLSESINLFHAECQSIAQQQQLMQMQEEMRTRQEAMIMQQNLNAARLSEQINTAKNEIEMDNFIQSCFVQDRLDSIYREVLDQR